MTATDEPQAAPIQWVERGKCLWETPSKRFDLLFAEASWEWVAFDHDYGKTARRPTRWECEEWVRERMGVE